MPTRKIMFRLTGPLPAASVGVINSGSILPLLPVPDGVFNILPLGSTPKGEGNSGPDVQGIPAVGMANPPDAVIAEIPYTTRPYGTIAIIAFADVEFPVFVGYDTPVLINGLQVRTYMDGSTRKAQGWEAVVDDSQASRDGFLPYPRFAVNFATLTETTMRVVLGTAALTNYTWDGALVYPADVRAQVRIDGVVIDVPLTSVTTNSDSFDGNPFYSATAVDVSGGIHSLHTVSITFNGSVDVPRTGSVLEFRNSDGYGNWMTWRRIGGVPVGSAAIRFVTGTERTVELDTTGIETFFNSLTNITYRQPKSVLNVSRYSIGSGTLRETSAAQIVPDLAASLTTNGGYSERIETLNRLYRFDVAPEDLPGGGATNANIGYIGYLDTEMVHKFGLGTDGRNWFRLYLVYLAVLQFGSLSGDFKGTLWAAVSPQSLATGAQSKLLRRAAGEDEATEIAVNGIAYISVLAWPDVQSPALFGYDTSAAKWRVFRSENGETFTAMAPSPFDSTYSYVKASPLLHGGAVAFGAKTSELSLNPVPLYAAITHDGETWGGIIQILQGKTYTYKYASASLHQQANADSSRLVLWDGTASFFYSDDFGATWTEGLG